MKRVFEREKMKERTKPNLKAGLINVFININDWFFISQDRDGLKLASVDISSTQCRRCNLFYLSFHFFYLPFTFFLPHLIFYVVLPWNDPLTFLIDRRPASRFHLKDEKLWRRGAEPDDSMFFQAVFHTVKGRLMMPVDFMTQTFQ